MGRFLEGMPFQTDETRRKISMAHTGKIQGPHSEEHKEKISIALKKATAHVRNKKDCPDYIYQSAHKWMQRKYGKPQLCENCPRTVPPEGKGLKVDYFHRANKSGKYLKDRSDWQRLCSICHRNYDYSRCAE